MNTVPMTREIEEAVQKTCALLIFRLAEQAFALNIENVVQIIPMLRLTPVPQIDHTIEGIANIHGALVPVISVRRHLGLQDLRPGLYTPIILTRVGERQVGWIVDDVTDVISVPADSIIVPATILPEGMDNSPVMSGLVYQDNVSILVLDPRYILRPSQIRKLNRAFPSGLVDGSAQPGPVSVPLAPDEAYAYSQAIHPDRAALETVRAALARKQSELQAEKAAAAPSLTLRAPAQVPAAQVPAAQAPTAQVPAAPVTPKPEAAQAPATKPVQPEPPVVEVVPAAVTPSNGASHDAPAAQPVKVEKPAKKKAAKNGHGSDASADAANDSGANGSGNGSGKNGSKKSGKSGGKKGSIIPNTAIDAVLGTAVSPALPEHKGRDIRDVLAAQFAALAAAALAAEVSETENKNPEEPGA